jgi:hypothetical protein
LATCLLPLLLPSTSVVMLPPSKLATSAAEADLLTFAEDATLLSLCPTCERALQHRQAYKI